jgi:hypothetical protein
MQHAIVDLSVGSNQKVVVGKYESDTADVRSRISLLYCGSSVRVFIGANLFELSWASLGCGDGDDMRMWGQV